MISSFELACTFQRYQERALETLFAHFDSGQQHFLLLAPPGSGKTLIGLACLLRLGLKTLILSPNTTIQQQWLKQFETHGVCLSGANPWSDVIATEVVQQPAVLSSTYQQLSSAYRQGDAHLLHVLSNYDFIILDECHHVMRKWGQAILHLDTLRKQRGNPPTLRLGLTATPPVEVSVKEQQQLWQLLGDVDYEISLPAMIRSGHLSPFQDLVYLVRPSAQESQYIHSAHEALHDFQKHWCHEQTPDLALFSEMWLLQWQYELDKDQDLYLACLRYLHDLGLSTPDIGWHPEQEESLTMDNRAALLGAYALAQWGEQHETFKHLQHTLSLLGYRYRQEKFWPIEGQVEKVLGLSSSKLKALNTILKHEYAHQYEQLRCLVLTDFALTHAPGQRTVLKGVADPDAGGALRLFRSVCLETPEVKPFLMTGRYVLCCKALLTDCLSALKEWLPNHELRLEDHGLFTEIQASPLWSGKDYVACLTQLFSEGKSLCLIGTRGLLGEGWDCPALNTLIDFTRTTTFVSVNQIRGRSLRKDPQHPFKVANQWDIVALLPELESGLKDLERWQRKHRHYYGLCDDGLIEKGVGHVHASFTRQDPRELFLSLDQLNDTMCLRATQRLKTYDQWQVGTPYRDVTQDTLQIAEPLTPLGTDYLATDHLPADAQQVSHLREEWLQQRQRQLSFFYGLTHLGLWGGILLSPALLTPLICMSVLLGIVTAITQQWQRGLLMKGLQQRLPIPHHHLLEALGRCLWLACLKLNQPELSEEALLKQLQLDHWQMLTREDGTLRFISRADSQRHAQWQIAFQELLAPLQAQRYWLSFQKMNVQKQAKASTQESTRWFLPVPFLFGRSHERARVFQEALLPVLGETQLHYTRQGAGKVLAAQHQYKRILPVQLQHISLWS